jgi:hypothetical protein
MTFSTIMVAFGSRIETRIPFPSDEFGPYVLLMWMTIRWLIAILTSIAVIALIYRNAVPRTQPWHSVLPAPRWQPRCVRFDGIVWLVSAEIRRLQHHLRLTRVGIALLVDVLISLIIWWARNSMPCYFRDVLVNQVPRKSRVSEFVL